MTHGNIGLENLLSIAVNPRYSTGTSFPLSSAAIFFLCTSQQSSLHQLLLNTVITVARKYKRICNNFTPYVGVDLAVEWRWIEALGVIHTECCICRCSSNFEFFHKPTSPAVAYVYTASVKILQTNEIILLITTRQRAFQLSLKVRSNRKISLRDPSLKQLIPVHSSFF